MNTPQLLRVVITAAGSGRRLGRDKATLPWGRKTLIEHVVSQFPPERTARLIVVAGPHNEAILRESLSNPARVVLNPDPASDMIDSIRIAIQGWSETGGPLCIHPTDVFGITQDLVAMLHDEWRAAPDHIHLPAVGSRGAHPLIIPGAMLPEIHRIPSGQGLRYLLSQPDLVRRHPWPDKRLLCDIDTPDDYRRWAPG